MRHLVAAATLGAVVLTAGLSQAQIAPPPTLDRIPTRVSSTSVPLPIGTEDDVYCSGWIGEMEEAFPGAIGSAEKVDNQDLFFTGDVVYLDIGAAAGVAPGEEFWIVRPERPVNRWGSELEYVGRVYLTPGRIRVICVQENSSIAEIMESCSDVAVGDKILPFEPIPIPLIRRTRPMTSCDPPNGKLGGHIVATRDAITPIATDAIVFIDRGETDGLGAGDFLTVYRERTDVYGLRTILGEMAILMTKPKTAVAKITWMHDTMGVGDPFEAK